MFSSIHWVFFKLINCKKLHLDGKTISIGWIYLNYVTYLVIMTVFSRQSPPSRRFQDQVWSFWRSSWRELRDPPSWIRRRRTWSRFIAKCFFTAMLPMVKVSRRARAFMILSMLAVQQYWEMTIQQWELTNLLCLRQQHSRPSCQGYP